MHPSLWLASSVQLCTREHVCRDSLQFLLLLQAPCKTWSSSAPLSRVCALRTPLIGRLEEGILHKRIYKRARGLRKWSCTPQIHPVPCLPVTPRVPGYQIRRDKSHWQGEEAPCSLTSYQELRKHVQAFQSDSTFVYKPTFPAEFEGTLLVYLRIPNMNK